ncbi:MAG: antitoxin [Candidatus Methylomirabilota bacterium]|nr:DUF6364 family protein [Candidatus Methylomirabilis sp.]NJD67704.1 antitoxin [candidate division NC10 bacterium]PWB47966.1 MAG: antitoxin [candidate division NC10 bacterium]
MQTKLTLRLKDHLIRRAKAYASEAGKSVSQLVADYFALLDQTAATGEDTLPPLTRSLYGALAPSRLDEADYYTYLKEKHR